MSFLPWSDLDNPNNPLSELARAQTQAMCELRRLDPFLFNQRLPGLEAPNFGTAPERFWDRVCNPLPPERQNRRPFGGQCVGVPYDAQLYDQNGDPQPWRTSSGGGPIPGPIETASFQLRDPDPAGSGLYRTIAFGFTNVDGTFRGRVKQDPAGAYLYDERWSAQLYRTDGLPDTCDDPPPPPPPPDPPPQTRIIPVTINNITTNFEVNLPDLVTNDWPDFEFRPVINMGGVRAEFTLGGINFPDLNFPDWPEIPPINVNLNPTLNAIADLDAVLQVGLGNININIEGIRGPGGVDLTELEQLIRCCACEEGVTYAVEAVSPSTPGGKYPLPGDCVAVVVFADLPFTRPTPTISRSGTEPDVFVWGTVAVGYGDGFDGVVQRLSYAEQSIPTSEAASTVTVTPHYQNTCSIIAITKQRNC